MLCFTAAVSLQFMLLRVQDFLDWKMRWRIQSKMQSLRACEKDVTNMIVLSNCNPIMLRLAWSDAGDRITSSREQYSNTGNVHYISFCALNNHTSPSSIKAHAHALQSITKTTKHHITSCYVVLFTAVFPFLWLIAYHYNNLLHCRNV